MSGEVPKRPIDKIVAHFAATKGTLHRIETAWGFPIYYGAWTLGEKDFVFGNDYAFRPRSNARLLIAKAVDAVGVRLFSLPDETELLNEADPKEVARIAAEILRKLNEDNAATQDDNDTGPKA